MTDVQDKTIVITGASRGIGEATARYFAQRGANVVLAARSEDDIKRIAGEITAEGGNARALTCDVSDYDQVAALIAFGIKEFGRIDILLNNAGVIEPVARLADSDPVAWSKAADINYKSVYFGLHAVIPHMVAEGGGTIINISTGAASGAMEGWSHYCSSKAGALSLTRCADEEYREEGINVIGLSPGTVATVMQDEIRASGVNPVSQLDPGVHIPAEWVAKTVLYLCGEEGVEFVGQDFSMKTNEGRSRVGLPPV